MTFTRPCGVISSLTPTKPLTSQNSTVMTRRWPSAASAGPLDQPFDDARIDVAPERFADALLQPQLLDHAVEGDRQMADLVLRGHREGAVELAAFDRLRAFQQAANRLGQAGADDDREDEPERCGKRGQNDGGDHDGLLLAHGRRRVGLQQTDHLGPHLVELPIEFVAQFIDPLKSLGDGLLIAGVQQRQQTRVFLFEVNTGVVDHIGKAGVDANERGRVAEAGPFGDQGIEQLARGLGFPIDCGAASLEALAGVGVARRVGRRLDFLDHHAAQRHCAFQRVNIGPRQGGIGRDVALRELVQAAGDLHHQRQRDERRDRHQDDEDQGNSDNFALDRKAADHRAIFVPAVPRQSMRFFLEKAERITHYLSKWCPGEDSNLHASRR